MIALGCLSRVLSSSSLSGTLPSFFSIFLSPILFLIIFYGQWWSAVVFAVYGGLCIPSIAPGCPIIAETNIGYRV